LASPDEIEGPDESDEQWPIEPIPNADSLYFRVHQSYFKNKKLIPGVFKERDGSMSTDWSKYSTPEDSRQRATKPDENGILAFDAGLLRDTVGLTVTHAPDQELNNRAHTDVTGLGDGERLTEVRQKLLRHHKWAIEAPSA